MEARTGGNGELASDGSAHKAVPVVRTLPQNDDALRAAARGTTRGQRGRARLAAAATPAGTGGVKEHGKGMQEVETAGSLGRHVARGATQAGAAAARNASPRLAAPRVQHHAGPAQREEDGPWEG